MTKTYAVIDAMSIAVPFGLYQGLDLSTEINGRRVSTTMAYNFLRFVLSRVKADEIPIICLDPSFNERKEKHSGYKANRTGLSIPDMTEQLEIIRNTLVSSNFNVLLKEGYEADDLVLSSALKLSDQGKVKIYSCDADLTSGVTENVSWVRGHNQKKYEINEITPDNFHLALKIPYNTILLYKATVGDPADNIKGVKTFGKVAFGNWVEEMIEDGIDFSTIREQNREQEILEKYFGGEPLTQALECLEMVTPKYTEVNLDFDLPINYTTLIWWCEKYEMKSLVEEATALSVFA